MGLFDKKYCDVCGEKIGLIGNRKLEDGNLCKDCARKLSPLFSDRRRSTVDEIKKQLAYREENEKKLSDFHPTLVFGEGKKVYADPVSRQFIVARHSDWRRENPDLILFSQVIACRTDIEEHKEEIYRRTEDGKRESYHPRRYEYSYEFKAEIQVDSPWFSEIELELSDGSRPDSPYTDLYREYERQLHELSDVLTGRGEAARPSAPAQAVPPVGTAASGGWTCVCGAVNTGNFCESCGAKRQNFVSRCDQCGWSPAPGEQPPRFCPQCGTPFHQSNIR